MDSYKFNAIKILSPVIFCSIFRLPTVFGITLGITANHIDTNVLSNIKDMLDWKILGMIHKFTIFLFYFWITKY